MTSNPETTPAMPGTVIPLNRHRWKAGVLQVAYGGANGIGVWWLPVRTVPDDAPDYER